MKKLLFAGFMLSALFLGSCSNEEGVVPASNEGTVTFVAHLPGSMNRDYSDGLKATQLTYAVYDAATDECVIKTGDAGAPVVSFSERTATLSLNLVKGKKYNVIFWADKPGNTAYTFNADTKSITVDYSGIQTGDESRDAFFQVEKNLAVNGPVSKTIELRRPFAQLNWGTDDKATAEAAKVTVTKAEVKVSNVYTTLNLFTGIADGKTAMTFTKNTLPAESTFPGGGYDYLAMDYILTGVVLEDDSDVQHAQSEVLTSCSLKLFDDKDQVINTINVSNVPVQRNYRTNIVGSLLTSSVDFTVNVIPDYFGTEEYDKILLAAQNGGTVKLEDDVVIPAKVTFRKNTVLDLNGHTITFSKADDGYNDGLVFAGCTAVIKGGTIECENSGSEAAYGNPIWASTAANVTLEGVTVKGQISAYVGPGATLTINSGTFESTGSQCIYIANGSSTRPAGKAIINGGDFTSGTYNDVSYCLNVYDPLMKKEGAKGTDYIEVKGGTFHGYDPANSKSENPVASFVAEGYQSVESPEGVWTVSKIAE